MKEGTRAGLSGTAWVLIGLLVVALVAIGVPFAVNGISSLTADPRGKTSVREKTVANGDYRIAQYDKFYNACGDIQASEDQITQMRANKSLPKDQVETNVLALTNQRNILARQYNADSSKAGTQAQFKASDLPYSIQPWTIDNKEPTICAR